jgi:putative transposase
MYLTAGDIYHVFNRGNNKQRIFFSTENYFYFLQGVEKYLNPCCDILAWCLMPNHFHFLIHANSSAVRIVKDSSFERQQFSQGIKMLLSSYTKAINKQEKRSGSLFQQKTKGRCVSESKNNMAVTVFHYIHQNPMKAGLVSKMEDWDYSSFKEYIGKGSKNLCDKKLAQECLDLDLTRFYKDSYDVINFDYDFC